MTKKEVLDMKNRLTQDQQKLNQSLNQVKGERLRLDNAEARIQKDLDRTEGALTLVNQQLQKIFQDEQPKKGKESAGGRDNKERK